MKRKLLFAMVLFFISTWFAEISAQSMVIRAKDGTEQGKTIADIHKFTFSGDKLVLSYVAGNTENYSLASTSIRFKSATTALADVSQTESLNLSIWPNPAETSIRLGNLPQTATEVSIYRMDGIKVLKTNLSSMDEAIDVSTFSKGIYIVRVNNQALKFIKL